MTERDRKPGRDGVTERDRKPGRGDDVAELNRVVVIGGGLAGVAAAIRLADLRREVLLLEARPRLGGATYSFTRDGLTVDTGQHVFLRCYTRYRGLLDRMGVANLAPVQERFEIPVIRAGGSVSWLRRARRLRAPLHLLPALIGYDALSTGERLRAARAAQALRGVDPDEPDRDEETFGGWLLRHGQRERAVERLWGLLTVAALNLHPGEASLALAARVFRTGLLDDARSGDIGVPAVPLSVLHGDPAERLLNRVGVRCITGERVVTVDAQERGFVVRTATGEITSDAVVIAVPHQQASRLVPEAAAPERARWAQLGESPIVNVHVHYDRPVTSLAFSAALDSPVQWVFDRTRAAGADRGQYLVVSVSAADAALRRPTEKLRGRYLQSITDLFPAATRARMLTSFVTREPRATFRQRAGTAALRPPPVSRLPGLVLAGAWTATGWPDTMEGAVRSGLAAAEALASGEAAQEDAAPSSVPRVMESTQ